MIKINIILITLWALTQAAYVSRMAGMNRLRAPVAFRPGVMLQRTYPQRTVQTATRRAPYIVYRSTPRIHRFAMKHVSPSPVRNVFGPWKTTRIPLAQPGPTPGAFIRASASPIIHADGAIHTIPAPNLSLSEKPIVVIDSSEYSHEQRQPTYEVTEKYTEPPYQINPKIESPIGFSKASSVSAADLQNIVRQNTALQVASEYTLPVHFSQPSIQLQQPSIIPQQFSFQGFHAVPNQHELINREPAHIIIPQNAFYPPDSLYMQNYPTQFMQQYPGSEFVPYASETRTQYQTQPTEPQTDLFLLQNEQITKQTPSAFISNDGQKNVVQRETKESSFSIVPKAFSSKNVSENLIETDVTSPTIENETSYFVTPTEIQAPTTTIKNLVETSTEEPRTTPIFYAQIGQSVGNIIANGFYSAINDVRAAAEVNTTIEEKKAEIKQNENNTTSSPSTTSTTTTTTTSSTEPTTAQSEIKASIQKEDKTEKKIKDLPKLGRGSPFEKPAASVNVAYTLLRSNDKQSRVNEDGEVFAGQLVEAKISEDQEFNNEKASLVNRPPVRMFAVTEKRVLDSTPKQTVVKAKIPPKSKLTFDDKTGEPVLRVYASYIDSPVQKEIVTTKLANIKRNKDRDATRKQDLNIDWKEDDVKSLEKSLTYNGQEEFGLKLRSKSERFVPIFEDYEERK